MCVTLCVMNLRLGDRVTRRTALSLTDRDEADLARLRESPAREHLGLPEGNVSESALLHAVFAAGIRALEDAEEEAGYAELAVIEAATADIDRAVARRRRPERADEP